MVTFQDAYLDGANEFHLLCFGLLLGGYENVVCANYASSYPLVPEDRTRTVCCIVTRYKAASYSLFPEFIQQNITFYIYSESCCKFDLLLYFLPLLR